MAPGPQLGTRPTTHLCVTHCLPQTRAYTLLFYAEAILNESMTSPSLATQTRATQRLLEKAGLEGAADIDTAALLDAGAQAHSLADTIARQQHQRELDAYAAATQQRAEDCLLLLHPLRQRDCLAAVNEDVQADADAAQTSLEAQVGGAAAQLTGLGGGAVAGGLSAGGLGGSALSLDAFSSPEHAHDAALELLQTLWEVLPLPLPWHIALASDVDTPSRANATSPDDIQDDANATTTISSSTTSITAAAANATHDDANRSRLELLAPLVGFGLATSGYETIRFSGMSGCIQKGYPRYSPSTPNTNRGLLFSPPRDGLTGNPAPIEFNPLWQPFPFNRLNFLVDVDTDLSKTAVDLARCPTRRSRLTPQASAASTFLLAVLVTPLAVFARPSSYPFLPCLLPPCRSRPPDSLAPLLRSHTSASSLACPSPLSSQPLAAHLPQLVCGRVHGLARARAVLPHQLRSVGLHHALDVPPFTAQEECRGSRSTPGAHWTPV